MVYLLGVNLPDHKLVNYALTSIFGIGLATATKLTHKLMIHPRCRLAELKEDKLAALSTSLNDQLIESDLKRSINSNIQKLVNLGTRKGHRHKMGLPVHGQSTRSNARTAAKLNGLFLRKKNWK
jgi:small subunit ribosomal protein S13